MFIPKNFKNENLEEVSAFIKNNSFGILLSTTNNKIWGTHIPLELEQDLNGQEVIYGHVAKANIQWKDFEQNEDVLMIFNGPHAYVSSSWYSHENVPTWNYIAVHVYGKIKIIDEEELLYSITKLVDKYEAHQKSPVSVDKFSDKTMRQMKGIVGFKVLITEIQAAYKLSQNKNEEDYSEVINHLKNSDNYSTREIAEIMNKPKNK